MTAFIVGARRSAACPRGGGGRGYLWRNEVGPVLRACLEDAGIGADQGDEVILLHASGARGKLALVDLVALAAGGPG